MSRNAGRQLVGICTPRGREKIQFSNYFLKYFFFCLQVRSSDESSDEAPIKSNERQLIINLSRLLINVCSSSYNILFFFNSSRALFNNPCAS